jgi:hypothetical protein
MYNQAVNRASYEQPFHIAYVEIYDKNRIGDGDLFKILNQNQTPLLNHKTIDFIRGGLVLPGTTYRPGDQIPGADIMSVKDFNELFGKSIQIEEGHLINLMQTPAKYARNDSFFNTCSLEAGGTVYSFTVDKTICEMVINKTHFISSTIRLINHKDFINMQSNAGSYGNGKIHLMNFKNWRLTENISQKIDLALKEYNRNYSKTKIFNDINSEEYLFASTSRIQTYLKFKHEGGAALFLMGFTGLLFFFSSGCILYFKLFAEMEDTKLKYRKLLGIGILQLELKKLISDELKIVFFTPMFIGCLLGCSFMYILSSDSEMQSEFFIGSIIVAFAYFVFQAVYYLITQRKYINAIIDSNI